MTIEILMPALSPTMTEGTLAKWHKGEGDDVAPGDVIAEIETDKATMVVEAVDGGRVGKILVAEGTDAVKVNQILAVLLEEGEDASALATATESAATTPAPANEAQPEIKPAATTEAAKPVAASTPSDGGRVFASPLARRLATKAGLDLGSLRGSGPRGRIVKADVEGAAKLPAVLASEQPAGEADFELVPHTSMRRAIARRLTESKQTVPHFYLTIDCQIDRSLN